MSSDRFRSLWRRASLGARRRFRLGVDVGWDPPNRSEVRKRRNRREYDQGRRRVNSALARAARFRSSSVWQTLREWYRRRHPLCEHCLAKDPPVRRPMQVVDHIVSLVDNFELRTTESNLQSLCGECNGLKTQEERRSGTPQRE